MTWLRVEGAGDDPQLSGPMALSPWVVAAHHLDPLYAGHEAKGAGGLGGALRNRKRLGCVFQTNRT